MKDNNRTKIWHTWNCLIGRCKNISDPSFQYYDGRGVKVCDRWGNQTPIKSKGRPHTQGFLNFLEDMESTWFPGATIDRIDNDGDYTPENCQWLSLKDNVSKRNRELISLNQHNFQGSAVNDKRIKDGKHNFQGSDYNFQRMKSGTHPSQIKQTCPYCQKEFSKSMITRWHGERCKWNHQPNSI